MYYNIYFGRKSMDKKHKSLLDRLKSIIKIPKKNTVEWDKDKINFFSSLRFKLFALFLVPVACIILLGIVSYNQASSGIENNYKKSTADSINMAAEYMRFGLENVQAT